MYSDQERKFYVEKMWSEGLRPATASRLWGGPSRKCLGDWEKDALAGRLDASMPPVKGRAEGRRPHQRYPQGTVDEALRLLDLGKPAGEIAAKLGISRGGVVRAWARARDARAAGTIPPKAKRAAKGAAMDEGAAGELERLRLENAALRELMRDPKAGDPASLSPRRRSELCGRLRRETGLPLRTLLAFLSLPKSTYEYHRARAARGADPREAALDEAVARAFAEGGGAEGYRRVRARVLASGDLAACPERKVRASMRRQGLVARSSRAAKRWSSYAGEISDAPENLLAGPRGRHDFRAGAPDEKWVTDITEMKCGDGGKLYLSVVVDLFDGRVVGWRTSRRPGAEIANLSLLDAIAQRRGRGRTIIHSDRGCHYRWPGWIEICEEAGLVRSMSRKGRSPDNAACEGFFGRMKVEMYYGRRWSQATYEELDAEVGRYIEWYNSGRMKSFAVPGRKTRTAYETIDGRRRRLGYAI